ncbi:MAG: tyrosine-type recombinase/integrase [Treponema sp.]|nr:tyrosine-type recombinase/integrase [Treponema sp.]
MAEVLITKHYSPRTIESYIAWVKHEEANNFSDVIHAKKNEVLSISILDIDFAREEITVRYGKGGKDRHVMIPKSLNAKLKEHIKKVKSMHDKDFAEGWGSVQMRNLQKCQLPYLPPFICHSPA